MKLIATHKKFVTGSIKEFGVYSCIVEDIHPLESGGKQWLDVKIGGRTFRGAYDAWVHEYLEYTLGEPTIVVLFHKTPAQRMLSYVRCFYEDYADQADLEYMKEAV